MYMKPFFVYKFDLKLSRQKDKFFELFNQRGEDMEEDFLNYEIEKLDNKVEKDYLKSKLDDIQQVRKKTVMRQT